MQVAQSLSHHEPLLLIILPQLASERAQSRVSRHDVIIDVGLIFGIRNLVDTDEDATIWRYIIVLYSYYRYLTTNLLGNLWKLPPQSTIFEREGSDGWIENPPNHAIHQQTSKRSIFTSWLDMEVDSLRKNGSHYERSEQATMMVVKENSMALMALMMLLQALVVASEEVHDTGTTTAEVHDTGEVEEEELEPFTAVLFPWFTEILGVIAFFLLTRFAHVLPYTAVM